MTLLTPFDPELNYHGVEWSDLTVDVLLFGALSWLALRADRFWPMWLAAIELIVIGVHGARAWQPGLLALTYSIIVSKTAYLLLSALVIAARRSATRRATGLPEFAWTADRHAHASDDIGPSARDVRRRPSE